MNGRHFTPAFRCLAMLMLFAVDAMAGSGQAAFHRFEWASFTLNGQTVAKAAILVPIGFPGTKKRLYAQLDTGSDATFFYGKNLGKHGVRLNPASSPKCAFVWGLDSLEQSSLTGTAFVDTLGDDPVDTLSSDPVEKLVGTIGADVLKDRILVLDFPKTQFAVLTDSLDLPPAIRSSVQYSPAVLKNGKLYVQVVIGGDTLGDIFYDCGSSMSTLTLPLKEWQRATGLIGNEPEVKRDSIPAFGRNLEKLSAVAKGDLTFGALKIRAPFIDHVRWENPSLADFKILGNAPFYDDCVIVADFKYGRLGVAKLNPPKSPR